MTRQIILIIFLVVLQFSTYSQIPIITTPKPATFTNYSNGFNQNQGIISNSNTINNNTQAQNEAIIREYQEHQRKLNQQKSIKNYKTISYELPSRRNNQGADNFINAYNEIEKMLSGEQPLNLKKAVFLTENAYLGNRLN